MHFFIDELEVAFPYDLVYPEQYSYMCDLKRTLDVGGHCVLEMPSGTGKTVSLLSLIVAYQQASPEPRKLIYCSRTVPEIEKALAELKRLCEYRKDENPIMGIGLTSRKNLCIHPQVAKEKKGKAVDARCRDLTNAAVCERGRADPGSVELCDFHEKLGEREPGDLFPRNIWTLDDIKQYGIQEGICPYFAVRRMLAHADIVIYSFHYLLDPKVAEQVSREMDKNSIVVFDEAHNIDNVCIESLSIDLTRPMLESAARSVQNINERIEEQVISQPRFPDCRANEAALFNRVKRTDATKLQDEYQKLVQGLQEQDLARDEEQWMTNPVLPEDILKEAIPGNIRRAEHFTAFLARFVEYLKTRMRVLHVVAETPASFLQHLKELTFIEKKPLKFCSERLSSLVRTLEIPRLDEYSALQKVAAFATLVATYEKG